MRTFLSAIVSAGLVIGCATVRAHQPTTAPLTTEVAREIKYRLDPDGLTITADCGARAARMHRVGRPALVDSDEVFNYGVRRGRSIAVSGDRPRFALLTHPRLPNYAPLMVTFGDLRFRLTAGRWSGWLDEAPRIHARFVPGGTDHRMDIPGTDGLRVELTCCQAGAFGLLVTATVVNDAAAPAGCELGLSHGGLRRLGRTMSAAYYVPTTQQDDPVVIAGDDDLVRVDCAALNAHAAVRTIPTAASQPDGPGRWQCAWKLSVPARGRSAVHVLLAGSLNAPPDLAALRQADPARLTDETQTVYRRLLDDVTIRTPDAVLDAALRHAAVNMEYEWDTPCWLEGVHWWAAPWADSFQISAALALGQTQRATDTLRAYNAPGLGPSPNMNAAHVTPQTTQPVARHRLTHEGLPYYCLSLCQAVAQSGDEKLVRAVWPALMTNVRLMLQRNDADGNGCLHFKQHCNIFLYQADQLALPGDAASPTLMMAAMTGRLAEVARRFGFAADADELLASSRRMTRAALDRLWQPAEGYFASHIDPQGLVHRPHYYTDLVFAALYADLPPMTAWQCLAYLRRALMIPGPTGREELMRVGDLKPSMFGNDNVMPAQMCEAAEAFATHGDYETAQRMISAVALAATLYTEAPGSFPERMNDRGKGEANYLFGNPTGAYVRAVVQGLFGLIVADGGSELRWHPAQPDDWPTASLNVPHADVRMSRTAADGGTIGWRFEARHPQPRTLVFTRFLPPGHVVRVRVNGQAQAFDCQPALSRMRFSLRASAARSHVVEISVRPEPATLTGPTNVQPGGQVAWAANSAIESVSDPQSVLEGATADGARLTARVRKVAGPHQVFVTLRQPAVVLPIELTVAEPPTPAAPGFAGPTTTQPIDVPGLRTAEGFTEERGHATVRLRTGPQWGDGRVIAKGVAFQLRRVGDAPAVAWIELGSCHPLTGAFTPSSQPNTMKLPVGQRAARVHLLCVSEHQDRLTGAAVGAINLRYSTGAADQRPLVAGAGLFRLFHPYPRQRTVLGLVRASGRLAERPAEEVEWNAIAYVLTVPADADRVLEDAELSLRAADARLAVLAVTVESPRRP